jgi:ABC-type phosphate transport system substrate-binding protein
MNRLGSTLFGITLSVWGSGAFAEVVPVVSAKSPVSALTKNQVVDIFLGKASRFPDGTPAVPIDLAEGSSTRDEFYARFAGKSPAQLTAHWSKIIFTGRGQPPREVATGAELKKRLASTPGAIGYLEHGEVDASVQVVPLQ